jgi:uncharacterized BrkB/YihY/UPF0761 family membrane protein
VVGTSHVIQKVLQSEIWSLGDGDHRWFGISTREKRHMTRDNIVRLLLLLLLLLIIIIIIIIIIIVMVVVIWQQQY